MKFSNKEVDEKKMFLVVQRVLRDCVWYLMCVWLCVCVCVCVCVRACVRARVCFFWWGLRAHVVVGQFWLFKKKKLCVLIVFLCVCVCVCIGVCVRLCAVVEAKYPEQN